MKKSATAFMIALFANNSICFSQTGYVAGQPSIDCTNAHNSVARMLCKVPEAAIADWDLNSAWWALYFTLDDAERRTLESSQQAWRQSLDQACALPRYPSPEDLAGQAMAETFGRMLLGPGLRIPGPQPITRAHVKCVLKAYQDRAKILRSKLVGDALAESQLNPEQHAELQAALAKKGFLRPGEIGPGTHDGEFGPITRNAIKQFQQSLGVSATGYLSNDQRLALLESPQAAKAREDAPAAQSRGAEDTYTKQTQITSLSDYAKHVMHRWAEYDQDGNQTSYIDLASIIRIGDTLTVLDMQDLTPPQVITTGEHLGSVLTLVRYDCGSTPRSMIMASVSFHRNMGVGTQQDGADDVPHEPFAGWHVMGRENEGMLKAREMACKASSPASNSPPDYGANDEAQSRNDEDDALRKPEDRAAPKTDAEHNNACKKDYTKCEDNTEFMKNSDALIPAQVDCKQAAEAKSKYGDPKWPWLAFSNYSAGNEVRTGRLLIGENNAQFQNAFGAWEHVRVVCEYDLKTEKVISVDVIPKD